MVDYGPAHRTLREYWAPIVSQGQVTCTRHSHPQFPDCPGIITPIDRWELGHDDEDADRWTGPEHEHCNRKAGGLKRAGKLVRIDAVTIDEW